MAHLFHTRLGFLPSHSFFHILARARVLLLLVCCATLSLNLHAALGDDWQWINPAPSGNTVNDMIWDGNRFISVGTDVKASTDGESWSILANVTGTAIAYSGSQYVIVGRDGALLCSSDGINWNPYVSGTTDDLVDVIWNGTQFTAVSSSGDVSHSANGITWTLYDTELYRANAVVYGANKYIASGNSTSGISTSADGISWTLHNIDGYHTALATNGSIVVGVGKGGRLETTYTGTSWTQQITTGLIEPWFNDVKWDGERFIAVASIDEDERYIWVSTDGTNWNGTHTDLGWQSVASSGDKMLVSGQYGTLLLSDDAVQWRHRHFDRPLRAVRWINNQFLIFSDYTHYPSDRFLFSSPNGINWTAHEQPNLLLFDMIYRDGKYIAVGAGYIHTSLDGITWTALDDQLFGSLTGIAWNGERYVIVGGNMILTSSNGENWVEQTSPTTASLRAVIWDGQQFVAVGANGTHAVITSPDGLTWSTQQQGTYWFTGLAFNGTTFVATTNGSSVYISDDAISWTLQTTPASSWLDDILWNGTQFFATGRHGDIVSSPDGINWTAKNSITTNPMDGIAFSPNAMIAVGEGGTIIGSFGNPIDPNDFTFEFARKIKPSQIDASNRPVVDVYMNILGLDDSIIPDLDTDHVCGVTENGQEITDYELNTATGLNLNFSIVLDRSGSFSAEQGSLNDAASTLIGLMSDGDQASVVNFASSTSIDALLTSNTSSLLDAVNNPSGVGSGTALYDGIIDAVETLESIDGQRAIFVVTDGEDTASIASLQSAISAANAEDIPVYPIGFGSGVDTSTLNLLANSSNGEFFASGTTAELTSAITELRTLMANQYVLSYTSPDTSSTGEREVIICIDKADNELVDYYTMPAFSAPQDPTDPIDPTDPTDPTDPEIDDDPVDDSTPPNDNDNDDTNDNSDPTNDDVNEDASPAPENNADASPVEESGGGPVSLLSFSLLFLLLWRKKTLLSHRE